MHPSCMAEVAVRPVVVVIGGLPNQFSQPVLGVIRPVLWHSSRKQQHMTTTPPSTPKTDNVQALLLMLGLNELFE